MKQIEKSILIVIIIILVAVIASGATYIIMSNKEEKTNKDNSNAETNNNLNDNVKLANAKKEPNKIIEEFNIVLNGDEKNISIEFTYNDYFIEGKYNNKIVAFLNNYDNDDNKEEMLTISNVKKLFNEDNFKIIKGTDSQNYLLLLFKEEEISYENNVEVINNFYMYILDHNLNFISNDKTDYFEILRFENNPCEFENNVDPFYKNTFNINLENALSGNIQVEIKDDKIYYLAPIIPEDYNEQNYGVLEERVYTINNNKLSYDVINTYKITSICQQT